jgi:hypothetical protein
MNHHVDTKKQYIYITKAFDPALFKILAKLDAYVAGGAISCLFTERPINDFDIYFQKEGDEKEVIEYFGQTSNWKHDYTSSLSASFKSDKPLAFTDPCDYGKTIVAGNQKIQLVTAYHGEYQTIFTTFDFHCCMGAFLFKQNEFVFDPYFITDNMSRTIRFNYEGVANALTTLFRVEKYKKYGFTITFEELLKIIFAIKKIKLNTMKELKEFIRMLPPGIYKKILMRELIDTQITEIGRKYSLAMPDGKEAYDKFMNSPCNIDSVISVISDMNTYIEAMKDDVNIAQVFAAGSNMPFGGPLGGAWGQLGGLPQAKRNI